MNITPDMLDYDGDAVIVTVNGRRYRVTTENDYDSTPFDADCYDAEDIERWRNDMWYYVGVIVTPLDVPENKQFELSGSLWAVEFDFPLDPPQEINGRTYYATGTDYIVMHYPVPDMIEEVISFENYWRESINRLAGFKVNYNALGKRQPVRGSGRGK